MIIRRLRARERGLHRPHVKLSEECALGKLVYVVNPYERCAHGCAFCYAEWSWSPDDVVAHVNIAEKVRRELRRMKGSKIIVCVGSATDPYQPAEAELRLTRRLLRVLIRAGATFFVATRSDLVLHDLDLLAEYPRCWVVISVPHPDPGYYEAFEPGAPPLERRLDAIQRLIEAGVPVVARVSPLLPFVGDDEMTMARVLGDLAACGVRLITADVLKLDRSGRILYGAARRPPWKRTLAEALREYGGERLVEAYRRLYYEAGELLYGYVVPPTPYRLRVLRRLAELARERGMLLSTCRMGIEIKRQVSTWREGLRVYCSCVLMEPAPIGA